MPVRNVSLVILSNLTHLKETQGKHQFKFCSLSKWRCSKDYASTQLRWLKSTMTSHQPSEFPTTYFSIYAILVRNHFIFISPRNFWSSVPFFFFQMLALPLLQWTLLSLGSEINYFIDALPGTHYWSLITEAFNLYKWQSSGWIWVERRKFCMH